MDIENSELIVDDSNIIQYCSCDRYKTSDKRTFNFCKAMSSHTKKHKDYYKNYIDSILIGHKTKLPKEEVEKYKPILELISTEKPNLKLKIDNFIDDIDNISYMIDEFGKWYPINKLNTNYSDLSELLTYILNKFFNNTSTNYFFTKILKKDVGYLFLKNYDKSDTFLLSLKKQLETGRHLTVEQLLMLNNHVDIIDHDFFIKEALEKVFAKKISLTLDDLKGFVNNTIKNSQEGELIEDNIEKILINNGWEIIHRGGDGDFIDMKFGIDLIVKKNDIYKFIQIKKVWDILPINYKSKDFYKVTGKVTDVRDDSVDILALGTIDGKYILSERQNTVIERLNDQGESTYHLSNDNVLPSPISGVSFILKPFEGLVKF